jgi:hypothetical protein
MAMRFLIVTLCCTVCVICAAGAHAGSSECADAISQYNAAAGDVSTTLRRYANCVAGSKGHDDCSLEFRRLKSAQSDFETAVSQYASECD